MKGVAQLTSLLYCVIKVKQRQKLLFLLNIYPHSKQAGHPVEGPYPALSEPQFPHL